MTLPADEVSRTARVHGPSGVHPGLWAQLVKRVRGLNAELAIRIDGHEVTTASETNFIYQVPSLVGRDKSGEEVEVAARGPDAEEAVEAAVDYLENTLHPHAGGGLNALRRTYGQYDLPNYLEEVAEEGRADRETREVLRFFVGYLRIALEQLEDDLQLQEERPRHPKLGEPAIPKLSMNYSREQGDEFYR